MANQIVAALAKRLNLSEARTEQVVEAVLGVIADLGLPALLGSKPETGAPKSVARKKSASSSRSGSPKRASAKATGKTGASGAGKRNSTKRGSADAGAGRATSGPRKQSTKRSPKGRT